MDKAGAYGIQGFGATIVERVDGDYFAVMGLAAQPPGATAAATLGLGYDFGPLSAGVIRVRHRSTRLEHVAHA